MRAISIAKPNQGTINEDAVKATIDFIAVSDGAGGGGIYADKWSAYLVDNLPTQPILTFSELDAWVESIWEPFYNDCEAMAKAAGGMVLNKFYDEGSFATLAAIWYSSNVCHWIAYGDSVAFCYNPDDDILLHSFGHLRDFGNLPYHRPSRCLNIGIEFESGIYIAYCAIDFPSFIVVDKELSEFIFRVLVGMFRHVNYFSCLVHCRLRIKFLFEFNNRL